MSAGLVQHSAGVEDRPRAFVTVSLASGRSIVIDSSECPTAEDAGQQICVELNLPNGCVTLVTSSGCELNNEDHIGAMCLGGVTAVILQDKLLEAHITAAVENHDYMAASALQEQLEALKEPALPEIDIQLDTVIQARARGGRFGWKISNGGGRSSRTRFFSA